MRHCRGGKPRLGDGGRDEGRRKVQHVTTVGTLHVTATNFTIFAGRKQIKKRQISLLDDADVSDLGERGSFSGDWELGRGRVENRDPWTKGFKGHIRVKKAYQPIVSAQEAGGCQTRRG